MSGVTTEIRMTSLLGPIVTPWIALLVIGVIMVASAATALGDTFLSKHLLFLAVALVAFCITFAVPPAWWSKLYLVGWLVAFVIAAAVLIPGLGHEVKGASRWIKFAGFSLQAAEVAKFGLCIYLAGYLSRHHMKLIDDPKVLMVPLAMICVVCGLLIVEPDLGSSVVIFCACAGLLFVAGARLRFFVVLLMLAGLLLWALIELAPYRMARINSFVDPWAVAYESGYQLTQSLIAFGRGEFWGLGLGEGIQKLDYLPEAHNDFIFAVIAEELGALGAILLCALMAYFVYRIFQLAQANIAQNSHFAGYVCYFVGFILGFQFLVNLGVSTGALPTKGLTLPFVSYGGNSLVVCCALLGLLIRCSIDPIEEDAS